MKTLELLQKYKHIVRCMEYYLAKRDPKTGACSGLLYEGKPIWSDIEDPEDGPEWDSPFENYSANDVADPIETHWFVTSVAHFHRGSNLEMLLRKQRHDDQGGRYKIPGVDVWLVPGKDYDYDIDHFAPQKAGAKLVHSFFYKDIQDPDDYATDDEIEEARDEYYDTECNIEVDDCALASRSEGEGVWVQAWVWLRRQEEDDEQ